MTIKKSSNLVTLCGLAESVGAALALVPVAIIIAYANVVKDGPPHWFNISAFPCIALGVALKVLAPAVGGWATRGQDDVPTVPQVDAATIEARAQVQVQAAKADPAGDK